DELKVAHSGFVVAEVTHPSLGAGMELEVAKTYGVPIILLMKNGTNISRMPLGHPNVIASIEYKDHADARLKLGIILKKILGAPNKLRKKAAQRQRIEDEKLFV
ncbi:MAG: hypothetical protein V1644_04005, partial [Candidatus Micrarchaeota archaeon]